MKSLRQKLERLVSERLSPLATKDSEALREREEPLLAEDYRLPFSIDADRIVHSLAYTRYLDKTQVFSLSRDIHVTKRLVHVQLVSKIGRTIGRFLQLNEDLIEAIALGHDIGHPPFGHDGEAFLSELALEHGLPPFKHNVHGVRTLRFLERGGKGLNLTLQVYDGILCHDGESNKYSLSPDRTKKSFVDLDQEVERILHEEHYSPRPMSLEGCVVRLADTISYIGRDIEDAIRVGLIRREDIPKECRKILGDTNGKIVYRLVTDLIQQSLGQEAVGFRQEVAEALTRLKNFNLERIYLNPAVKSEMEKIRNLFRQLFAKCLEDLEKERQEAPIFRDFLNTMDESYREETTLPQIVIDFMAGMTDDYFVSVCKELFFPLKINPQKVFYNLG